MLLSTPSTDYPFIVFRGGGIDNIYLFPQSLCFLLKKNLKKNSKAVSLCNGDHIEFKAIKNIVVAFEKSPNAINLKFSIVGTTFCVS